MLTASCTVVSPNLKNEQRKLHPQIEYLSHDRELLRCCTTFQQGWPAHWFQWRTWQRWPWCDDLAGSHEGVIWTCVQWQEWRLCSWLWWGKWKHAYDMDILEWFMMQLIHCRKPIPGPCDLRSGILWRVSQFDLECDLFKVIHTNSHVL